MPGFGRLAAALCVLLAASAAADEGAYLTLVSMGRAAATDRGPDAGAPPTDAATAPRLKSTASFDVDAPIPSATAPAAPAPNPDGTPAAGYAVPAAAATDADVVAAENGAPGRRRWLRQVAALSPARRRAAAFAAPDVSTGTARALPAPPADDAAVRVGARRGLAEFLSVSAAPLAP